MIDPRQISEFEKKRGIKINIAYYESNEELYAKLKMTRGMGYDLIIPSDYMIPELIKEGLLQKLDWSKLNFKNQLNPHLLNLYSDPNNEYSIPYVWSIYGIGVDTAYFNNAIPNKSWSLLFDTGVTHAPRVMIEDARELILLTAFILYKSIENIDAQKFDAIRQLLTAQQKYTVAYTDVGSSYLLNSGTAALALSTSPYILRSMLYRSIDFIIPSEGTFGVVENLVLPKNSNNQELVYEFINFLYQPEVLEKASASTFFFSPLKDSHPDVPERIKKFFVFDDSFFKKMQFFRDTVSRRAVAQLWVDLKI
jgi:spermidine/putrescine transport system substrate-binding protein